jgi:hypothetical protein
VKIPPLDNHASLFEQLGWKPTAMKTFGPGTLGRGPIGCLLARLRQALALSRPPEACQRRRRMLRGPGLVALRTPAGVRAVRDGVK